MSLSAQNHSNYTFLGLTQSLCPECRTVLPAKIIQRGGRVYFRKNCPTHGPREDFVCSDVSQYDQLEFTLPSKLPRAYGVEPERGCPLDCGLCTEHEQHTCVGIVEITESCNLTCPMCYAESAPGGKHLSLAECRAAIDRLVEVEGRPEVLQLSGGEPTVHPQFAEILDYALAQPIDYVMINTNGIRLASDPRLVERLAEERGRVEIYFQLDGLEEQSSLTLRGESLVETKLAALEALGRAGLHVTLVCTLQPGVNDGEIGRLVQFAAERPHITSVSFQPATYSGRHALPEDLEKRITFPDVIAAVDEQTCGMFRRDDFFPLPCAHPNCHTIAYAYRAGGQVVPLTRFIDAHANMDLLANGVTFNRRGARDLIEQYLGRQGCCSGGCGPGEESSCPPPQQAEASNGSGSLPILSGAGPAGGENGQDNGRAGQALSESVDALADKFFAGALAEELGAENLFRITITSFLDAYNFDVRRLMKCCIHHVLPSGHVIPFCAYNVLYRDGHVPLPPLRQPAAAKV